MSFLTPEQVEEIRLKLAKDLSFLGKLYKAKKSSYYLKNVDHSLVDEMLKDGWEEYRQPLKTKTPVRKSKTHDRQFEDDVWCQFYNLGYRHLNIDDQFFLPYGKGPDDKKQIDVIAIDDETVILIECKSAQKNKRIGSLKTEFEGLEKRLDGFRKTISQVFGKHLRVKYIFATRNFRVDVDGTDVQRLKKTGSFFYNDSTYDYLNSLIKNYREAARYQFLGLLFKDQLINQDKVEVPAVEGEMGTKKYYMFSLEPSTLLKMSFILHRTRANEAEMPTYQRLLVPSRLKGIRKFISEGGYFPNSIIVNFGQKKHKLQFEASSRSGDTHSRFGMLKIPNAFAIAYIIDGQHRLYGYAGTDYSETNTIPVVAFSNLTSTEQLEIFFDINQNQKAVSPTLRLTLEEDLFWGSDRADSRMKALRSSIIKGLTNSPGPLYNKISLGEDKAMLSASPFANALLKSGLLPSVRGNKYNEDTVKTCIYDITNGNHGAEMERSRKNIISFLNLCYEFIEDNYPELFEHEKYFVLSNRGSYAFVTLLGNLNKHEVNAGNLTVKSSAQARYEAIEKYLTALFELLSKADPRVVEPIRKLYGTGGDLALLQYFQSLINKTFSEYNPPDLIDWREKQNEDVQNEGRKYGIAIEKHIKKVVLKKLQVLFKDNWDIEIGNIKRECLKRAEEEIERQYKEGLGRKDIKWTDMFNINDYKTIIKKYWTKKPTSDDPSFVTFADEFSIRIPREEKFNSQAEKTKWISYFNSYRNLWAHEGSKEKRLNKEEVKVLEHIYNHFYSSK